MNHILNSDTPPYCHGDIRRICHQCSFNFYYRLRFPTGGWVGDKTDLKSANHVNSDKEIPSESEKHLEFAMRLSLGVEF